MTHPAEKIIPPAVPAANLATALPPPDPDPGYRAIWYALGKKFPHGDKYSGGLGTYTANHKPMAVHAPEVGKTFFTYGGTPGRGLRQLLIMVGYYDHQRNVVGRPLAVHADAGVDDPHDNASLQIDPEGYLWLYKSGRGNKRPGYIYRSNAPYAIGGFARLDEQTITYPQPYWVNGSDVFLLFTKYTAGRELYWKTRLGDGGWSADGKLAGFGGHYQVSGEQRGKIATFFNYHPGGDVDKRTNIYYAQTTDLGVTWTTADGRLLSLPLATVHNDALIRDLAAESRTMYTCDLNFDEQGNPILLYVSAGRGEPGPPGEPREWVVSHWTGAAWVHHVVTTSTHNYDMGSLYVTGREWRIIAPTIVGPQKWGTGGEMALWVSEDLGHTWRMERQITRDSEFNHSYARRPLGAADPFYAYWADGDPDKLSPSRLYFTDSKGEKVWRLPYDMDSETASPVQVT